MRFQFPVVPGSGLSEDQFVHYHYDELLTLYQYAQEHVFRNQCPFQDFTHFVWINSSSRRPTDFHEVVSGWFR